MSRLRWLALLALLGAAACGSAQAGMLAYCDRQTPLSPAQQDRLLRFSALVKQELEQSGQELALIARAGLDLSRFGQRYSHAGVSLKASANAPWSVRQLYFDCDERKPKIFDQGIAGFLLGADDPQQGYVSLLFLPEAPAAALARTAGDNRAALALLGGSYSANAYPFSERYQNCNQWVMELLASAWAANGDAGAEPGPPQRGRAQRWLSQQGYEPSVMEVGWVPLMWVTPLVPWVHNDDHPREDLAWQRYRVSMPASIERFVRQQAPAARRVEFCHTDQYAVIRRGWAPIAEGCQPEAGDTVVRFD